PHAEVMALRQAKERGVSVAGATFYVTLEPCSHHGRTPPCADALIKAGAGRVVLSMYDPNPLVAGDGGSRFRQAGITVDGPLCVERVRAINAGFFARMTRGRPWLWMKMAASLDGRSALPDGRSQWITGPQARDDGHHWRARSCVVLTGIGTVQADDPRLGVRAVDTPRPPIKAGVDTQLKLAPQAAVVARSVPWACRPRHAPPCSTVRSAGSSATAAIRSARRNWPSAPPKSSTCPCATAMWMCTPCWTGWRGSRSMKCTPRRGRPCPAPCWTPAWWTSC